MGRPSNIPVAQGRWFDLIALPGPVPSTPHQLDLCLLWRLPLPPEDFAQLPHAELIACHRRLLFDQRHVSLDLESGQTVPAELHGGLLDVQDAGRHAGHGLAPQLPAPGAPLPGIAVVLADRDAVEGVGLQVTHPEIRVVRDRQLPQRLVGREPGAVLRDERELVLVPLPFTAGLPNDVWIAGWRVGLAVPLHRDEVLPDVRHGQVQQVHGHEVQGDLAPRAHLLVPVAHAQLDAVLQIGPQAFEGVACCRHIAGVQTDLLGAPVRQRD
mmetsp:Transcript_9605/g.18041  ORF Transcript_9605/g.18041 Transcript_9605/m.18041 type:complete len:269 (-) Transcript_9605:443-1249(-)